MSEHQHSTLSQTEKELIDKESKTPYNKLTQAEERVIVHKGTEAPFSGKYDAFYEAGTYVCKRCNAELYQSSDKFKSGCGWPSFDDEIKNAVRRKLDADGSRIEILCANCEAHLGHVFLGEGLSQKNTRHCVNSISLVFVPEKKKEEFQKAYFAGGCFWGVEYLFEHKEGVIDAVSGYMGGSLKSPSYQDVCAGDTGHVEVVEVSFDPNKLSYEEVVKFFFEIHDPTQAKGQGPDIGSQYLSVIFYNNEDEKKTSEKLIAILKSKGYKVLTKVLPVSDFWKAEEYHQNHYDKKKTQPYCHAYHKKF